MELDTTIMESIANFGIMVVISAIVVIFIGKVLNQLLDQAKKTNELAFAELPKITDNINEKFKELLTLVNNNASLMSAKTNTLLNHTDNLLEEQDRTQRSIENLTKQNIAYITQINTIVDIQRSVLKDIQQHCPAVYSREVIFQECIKRGYITREQIDEVLDDMGR